MGLIGDILSIPLDIANAPIKAAEEFMDGAPVSDDDGFFSAPLDILSKQIKKI